MGDKIWILHKNLNSTEKRRFLASFLKSLYKLRDIVDKLMS